MTGPHAHFAERRGNVLRYPVDVSPFVALPLEPDAADWKDIAALAGPGALVPFAGVAAPPPDGWEIRCAWPASRWSTTVWPPRRTTRPSGWDEDVPEMLDLVERTRPGPFLPRTIELGTYLGIRRDGALVAMAGERLHPPGWTEISAVCTDEAFRGQGLATRLVHAVAAGIRERGETPFLHAAADNTTRSGCTSPWDSGSAAPRRSSPRGCLLRFPAGDVAATFLAARVSTETPSR